MSSGIRMDLLFARLQIQAPGARSLLIARPRGAEGTMALAADLASAVVSAGARVRLLDATGRSPIPSLADGVERMEVLEAELSELDKARRALAWPVGYTVACAGGVLDRPAAIVLSAACDAVVLVAEPGKTMREDLTRAKAEIEAAGGRVAGAVLL